jgi:acetyltransferase
MAAPARQDERAMSTPATLRSDPSHSFFRPQARPLDAVFEPRSVAVVGATDREGSVGRTLLANLLQGFQGKVFAVNPGRKELMGAPCFPAVSAIGEPVDLAVVVTPAHTVPDVITDCVRAGTRSAVVISAGFKERGAEGAGLEREILRRMQGSRLRLIGPNCLGVMNPAAGLNATFAQTIARPGKVAFLSQSGALLTAILDWSLKELVGFSKFVSTGSMLDVGWGDLITYFGDDPQTEAILLYMESVGDARAFLTAAREVALTKPIIVIKAGRTEAAAQAAASHTGALTGSDEVLDAAFRRCGVLRVNSISDLFYMAETLGKQPRPQGRRLTIVTNAGGPGVLATDALIGGGGELAQLAPATLEALNQFLPPHWSHGNPVDILGDAGPERYARTLEVLAYDRNSDGLLVVMAPQGMTDPAHLAGHVARVAPALEGRPLLASWMGGAGVAQGEARLNEAGIPTFSFPDTAARAFNYMWQYSANLDALYEIPTLAHDAESSAPARVAAAELIAGIRAEKRELLTEAESKRLLELYRIPTVVTRVCASEEVAVAAAQEIAYPVVLKLNSRTITHKTDVGGVVLNLGDEAAVRRAFHSIREGVTQKAGAQHFEGVTVQPMVRAQGYELIVGSSVDPQFGPVLLFGAGGQLVEVLRDRALALPPLNTTLARRLIEQTRIAAALHGVRGRPPVDLAALERLLVLFSQLVVEQPWIREIDINPLLASHEGLLALDARVVLYGSEVREAELPRLAIRPYPVQYVSHWRAKDGSEVVMRPIRPEDEPLLVDFHNTLSERSVYLRYFQVQPLANRTAHQRLLRICFADYDRDLPLVVERTRDGGRELLAVGRLSRLHGTRDAEFAVLVSDRHQRLGIGTELLTRLIRIGRQEGIERITAAVLPENREMQTVLGRLGFSLTRDRDDNLVFAALDVARAGEAA